MEFKCYEMRLGYSSEDCVFRLLAAGRNKAEGDKEVLLVFYFSRAQAQGFLDEATAVISAGRPMCALCDEPVGAEEEHFCPKRNGHKPLDGED